MLECFCYINRLCILYCETVANRENLWVLCKHLQCRYLGFLVIIYLCKEMNWPIHWLHSFIALQNCTIKLHLFLQKLRKTYTKESEILNLTPNWHLMSIWSIWNYPQGVLVFTTSLWACLAENSPLKKAFKLTDLCDFKKFDLWKILIFAVS